MTALATAGIVVNSVLLGYADSRSDPVGKLTPRADISRPAARRPAQTTEREHTEHDLEEPDD